MSSSRIPGFYRVPLAERRGKLAKLRDLSPADQQVLETGGIDADVADGMVENVVGLYALPLGLGLNFTINGKDYVVPMAVEEPSVIAAASNAARMVRAGGGFVAEVSRALMIAQIQILDVGDPHAAAAAIEGEREALLDRGRRILPRLVARGGGPTELSVRILPDSGDGDSGDGDCGDDLEDGEQPMLVVHVLVDCVDAMGANMVNTLAEGLADAIASLAGGRPGLRILSNLSDRRTVTVTARVPDAALAPAGNENGDEAGAAVRRAIVSASRFAERDPYRAATHNKGIMNGVDAVLLATGNDWRGVEAGAHAFACQSGRYRPLAIWREVRDDAPASHGSASGQHQEFILEGRLHMPLAVATVGGALHVHAGARLALSILGAQSARELAAVVGAVGLASNLAALRALATDGIQRGHMSLHARMVARSAGATGAFIERVAAEMTRAGDVSTERARRVLQRLENFSDGAKPMCEDSL